MAIQYSGNVAQVLFDGSTKAKIITQLQTTMTAQGWTVISGGGSTNVLMESALTPQNLKTRFRIRDNGGTCVQCLLESALGTVNTTTTDSNAGVLFMPLAQPQNYRLVCSPYQVMMMTPNYNTARQFGIFGVPFIPTQMQGAVWEAGWSHGNGYQDASTNCQTSLRTGSFNGRNASTGYNNSGGSGIPNYQVIINGQYMSNWGNWSWQTWWYGQLDGIVYQRGALGYINTVRWFNDDMLTSDVLLKSAAMNPPSAVEPKIFGQIWDCVWVLDGFNTNELTTSFDSHNWICVSYNSYGYGQDVARGSFWHVIP